MDITTNKTKSITPNTGEIVTAFNQEGYLIIRNAVDSLLADKIKQEIIDINEGSHHVGYLKRHTVVPSRENQQKEKFRFKDLYVNSENIRNAVFAPVIINIIHELANEPIMAFQNLGFIKGSEQRVHRDSNFIAVDEMKNIFACWIALEDVEIGNGELVYYPQSHRLPTYEFSEGSSHWIRKRDGIYANEHYIEWLGQAINENSFEEKHFLARKGDCIIWNANLIHYGSPIQNKTATRYSLITHFCLEKNRPNYFNFFKNASRVKHNEKCYFSSCHYDLSNFSTSDELKNRGIQPIISTAD